MAVITHDVSRWSKCLWMSGRAINYQKSFYSMLIWKFRDDGTHYPAKNTELPPNTVQVPNLADP
eukprot:scaffold206895_cov35-Attheya_sp.AAC.1